MSLRARALVVPVLFTLAGCPDGSGSPPGSEPDVVLDGQAVIADAAPAVDPIVYIGRFDHTDPVGPLFGWPGSAIWTRFSGTQISVELSGYAMFDVEIDGVAQPTLVTDPGDRVYSLADGLPDGLHEVRITRRTESFIGLNQLYGFSGATLVPSPAPTRRIEMIGDSITCGWGVLGDGPLCPYTPATEAESHAWGAVAARALGAVHSAIAYSGKGVYQNWGGDTNDLMPALFERTLAVTDQQAWGFADTPQVVVINLGTNDFWNGDPGPPFVAAYTAFVRQVRGHYPNAWILLGSSPLLTEPNHGIEQGYLHQIAATLAGTGDPQVVPLDLATQLPADGYGCGYHPSERTQLRMATALVEMIRSLTGWD